MSNYNCHKTYSYDIGKLLLEIIIVRFIFYKLRLKIIWFRLVLKLHSFRNRASIYIYNVKDVKMECVKLASRL